MIIDFHTHIFPDKIAKDAITFLSEKGQVKPRTNGTLSALEDSMAESNVDISVVCNVATSPKQVESIFEFSKHIKSKKIFPLPSIHPAADNIESYLLQFKNLGFGGLKMHPDYQKFYIDDKKHYKIYEICRELDMFIIFHTGVDIGYPPPYHATPERIKKVMDNFPKLKIIAAHMGSYQMYDEVERYLFGKDIYFDTAYCLDKMPQNLLKKFFSKHPIERFLFATDSPWCSQKEYVDIFTSFNFLTEEYKEKIFYKNAKELLKI
ncbi:amidohydrolase family protein [Deferribacteraceae bacterium V6Fe1]|nr:amidohydrolase family protein [Deferribacteraceae bacterium V6Fe1]